MKQNAIAIIIASIGIIIFSSCTKVQPTMLPAETAQGANTLGYLDNGVPWVECSNPGLIGWETGGILDSSGLIVSAVRACDVSPQRFGFKLNSINNTGRRLLLNFNDSGIVDGYFSFIGGRSSPYSGSGYVDITTLDTNKQIVAGRFACEAFSTDSGSQTIHHITEGRFDKHYDKRF
jgi:hypothetical protein